MAGLAIVEPGPGRLGIGAEKGLGIVVPFVPDIGSRGNALASRVREQESRGDANEGDDRGEYHGSAHDEAP